jgi:hypothetical protein
LRDEKNQYLTDSRPSSLLESFPLRFNCAFPSLSLPHVLPEIKDNSVNSFVVLFECLS